MIDAVKESLVHVERASIYLYLKNYSCRCQIVSSSHRAVTVDLMTAGGRWRNAICVNAKVRESEKS
jgi:hypothetical protein